FFKTHPTSTIYTLSLHDALPIYEQLITSADHSAHASNHCVERGRQAPELIVCGHGKGDVELTFAQSRDAVAEHAQRGEKAPQHGDRKSTRLNSSHRTISYAVFCL